MTRGDGTIVGVAVLAAMTCAAAAGCAYAEAPELDYATPSRSFQVKYVTHVENIPANAGELHLWIPLPQDNKHQQISRLNIVSPFPYQVTSEGKYGNKMIVLSVSKPPTGFDVEVNFNVRRIENGPHGEGAYDRNADSKRFALEGNELIPLLAEIRSMAMNIVKEKQSQTEKARALYDHIIDRMSYDKTCQGWGRGDFGHARDGGKGNCTDFHAYFIGLCRNIGIPAYFEIGLSIPRDPGQGKTGGYHCWAYFFGHHCENRVAFSIGRDVVVSPAQNGKPLNFFIYPYAEIDGGPHQDVRKESFYRPLDMELSRAPVPETPVPT